MLDTIFSFWKKSKWYKSIWIIYKQSQISFSEFQFFLQRERIQQRGLLNCLMLTLFAVNWVFFLDERMRSSCSSNLIRRFLSRVRCICRTRIDGWCCSSRDLASTVTCRLLSFLQIWYGGHMNINSSETGISEKRRAIFASRLRSISDAAYFYAPF